MTNESNPDDQRQDCGADRQVAPERYESASVPYEITCEVRRWGTGRRECMDTQ